MTTGRRRIPTGWMWAAAFGVMALVGAAGWLATRSPDSPGLPAPEAGPVGSTRPEATTSVPPDTDPSLPTLDQIGDGGPLLGEPSGYSLFVGDELTLRLLDLDTGLVSKLPFEGHPRVVDGEWLVLLNPGTGTVGAVPLGQLERKAWVAVPDGGFLVREVDPGPVPGQVWLTVYNPEATRLRLSQISDGTVLHELERAPDLSGETPAAFPSENAVVLTKPGGVFEWIGGVERRVADGEVLAVSDALVLTRTCTGSSQCTPHWLDRRTWQPVDRPFPDDLLTADYGDFELTPGGMVLAYRSARGPELYDVSRGRSLELPAEPVQSTGASPDGRWVAYTTDAGITVYDTATAGSHHVDLSDAGGDSIAFVPHNVGR